MNTRVTIPPVFIQQLVPFNNRFIRIKGRGKEPVDREWTNLENALSAFDPRLIQWLEEGGNYGVVAGDGLIIIDADDREIRKTVEECLPETFTVKTGRKSGDGRHYYYACKLTNPIRLIGKANVNVGDIQGAGKQVIGPGSIHPDGDRYEIIKDMPIAEIDEDSLKVAFSDYLKPSWTSSALDLSKDFQKKKQRLRPCFLKLIDSVEDINHFLRLAIVEEGHANQLGFHEIVELFRNCDDFDIDITGNLVSYKLNDIIENGIKPWRCKTIHDKWHFCLGESCPKYSKKILMKYAPEDFFTKGKKSRFVPKKLADAIIEHHQFAAIGERSNLWVYVPDKGIWDINGIEKVQAIAVNWLERLFNSGYIQETIKYIRYSNYIPRDRFEGNKSKIVLNNGVYNIETGELEDFDPELYAVARLPIDYDPSAKCPNIVQFLNQLLPPEDVKKIIELVGYCLYRGMPIARIVVFVGEGANGKSTALNFITIFLGDENVSNLTLQELSQGGFRISQIYGKLANISADVPAKAIKDTSILKMLTGDDPITIEYKYKDSFKYHSYAKPIFSCNKLPETWDDTAAIYRRFVIINFTQTFTKETADINILGKITTPEELSGFFNLTVDGLKNFLEQGGFSYEKSVEERKKEYTMKSNPAQYFCENLIRALDDPTSHITKEELYQAYVTFCRQHKKRPMANNHFTTQAKRFLPYVEDGQKRIDEKNQRVWFGIDLKDEYKEERVIKSSISTKNDRRPDWLNKRS